MIDYDTARKILAVWLIILSTASLAMLYRPEFVARGYPGTWIVFLAVLELAGIGAVGHDFEITWYLKIEKKALTALKRAKSSFFVKKRYLKRPEQQHWDRWIKNAKSFLLSSTFAEWYIGMFTSGR